LFNTYGDPWFLSGTPVLSTNKSNCRYITRYYWNNEVKGAIPLLIFILYFTIIIDSYNSSNRLVLFMEQDLLTLPEQMSSPPVFSGVCVTRSLALCVCFVDRCLSFCTFSFGHCVVCSSSTYGFWLPLWYLQTLLIYQFVFYNIMMI